MAVDPARVRTATAMPEAEWRDAWKRYFKVSRLTRQFVVVPSWETYAAAEGEVIIDLDPGMAFGTGTHASTWSPRARRDPGARGCGRGGRSHRRCRLRQRDPRDRRRQAVARRALRRRRQRSDRGGRDDRERADQPVRGSDRGVHRFDRAARDVSGRAREHPGPRAARAARRARRGARAGRHARAVRLAHAAGAAARRRVRRGRRHRARARAALDGRSAVVVRGAARRSSCGSLVSPASSSAKGEASRSRATSITTSRACGARAAARSSSSSTARARAPAPRSRATPTRRPRSSSTSPRRSPRCRRSCARCCR